MRRIRKSRVRAVASLCCSLVQAIQPRFGRVRKMPTEVIRAGDVLVVIGTVEGIEGVRRIVELMEG
ncbi:hypothetical protein FHX81_1216 [Saccharothrix saharensis]|uniref:RCK C-terminal domain-containing protein n=1 Tax=Saccharothrix saharensis TaxID=571190 RepID=A0A543J7Y4_9PSEU|nr:hypothetical protein [Saccharothrix saharensis]TQM78927.1 hypothetical protein FHX81_1216 [Saccharothrix saharensis]